MKRIGSIAILIRLLTLVFVLTEFGLDTATSYGVFLIAIDVLQIRIDIKESKTNDV